MKTKWIYKDRYDLEPFDGLDIDRELLNILLARGISSENEIMDFLNPTIDNIANPFHFADVEKAVKRLIQARENDEEVWIYGDYDVDGITSTSICYLALKEFGFKVNYYIPLRDEGYGLNKEALQTVKDGGAKVVITVDCGISSIEEIDFANELGLDVIITDHHEINNSLPKAYAVINPKREDNIYHYKSLAGVGTAFMLILALSEALNRREEAYKYLDIVAIGTIADIVPLTAENRIFSKIGLEFLGRSEHIGLLTLVKNLFEDYTVKKFNTYDVGFIIAPVFNAAGRLEDAKMAVKLLITSSETEAEEISKILIQKNIERKNIQTEILENVEAQIEKNSLASKNVIVTYSEDYHHGVIGIVASKIVDKYYKPSIVMQVKPEEGIAVASCRSIETYNLIEGLNSMSDVFVKYGGHAGAAGFSIKIEKINEFIEKINLHAGSVLSDSDFDKPVKIEKTVLFSKLSYEFVNKLGHLEPYGFANPTPIFSIEGVKVNRVRIIGKDRSHLMFDVVYNGSELKNCVWFGNAHKLDELLSADNFNIAFKLKSEVYKDRYLTKLYIEDVKKSFSTKNRFLEACELYDTFFPMESVIYSRKEINPNLPIEIDLGEYNAVRQGRGIIGYLEKNSGILLKELSKNYNFSFKGEIKKIEKKEQNYNISITIDRELTFNSLAIKPSKIFSDIKEFLIGKCNYNSLQKKALATIFKEKANPLIISDRDRGINTLFLTIGIWNKIHGKKSLIVTNSSLPKIFHEYFEVSNRFVEGFDYYIFDDILVKDYPKNFISYSSKDVEIETSKKIIDNFTMPENIEIQTYHELISDYDIHNTYFSKKLPTEEKFEILSNLSKYKKILATKDIKSAIS